MTNEASPQPDSANAPDWDAIARFLAGESPNEEVARVRAWLEVHPEDRELVEQLDASTLVEPPADIDVEAALRSVHARLDAAPAPRLTLDRGGARFTGYPRPLMIGASLLAAAAAIFAFVSVRRTPPTTEIAGASLAHTYRTAVGQRDSITLADGSRVILGPASSLVVSVGYGTTTRAVELDGDGYFEVRHDATKPFTVRVGHALVEDLGTTFTIESDAGDATSVSVMSGSVRLRSSGSAPTAGSLLAAGDRGSLTIDGQVNAYPHTVVADDSAWTTGRLVFRDASLVRIAGELRRWYGVNVRIADSSLTNRHFTGTFNGEDSADQVLKVLGLSMGLRVERQGDSATVYSNHGPATTR